MRLNLVVVAADNLNGSGQRAAARLVDPLYAACVEVHRTHP
jgi:hypothetical protein